MGEESEGENGVVVFGESEKVSSVVVFKLGLERQLELIPELVCLGLTSGSGSEEGGSGSVP